MSYLGSSASVTVNVSDLPYPAFVVIWLQDVANNPNDDFTWGGNQVSFFGTVDDQYGRDLPGVTVTVTYRGVVLGNAVTDAFGYYYISGLTPYAVDNNAQAVASVGSIQSGGLILPIYGKTRIRNLAANPQNPVLGASVTISGVLEVQTGAAVWSPLSGKTVSITGYPPSMASKVVTVTSNPDGSFSGSFVVDEAGLWDVFAEFTGNAQLLGVSGELVIGTTEEGAMVLGVGLLLLIMIGGAILLQPTKKGG